MDEFIDVSTTNENNNSTYTSLIKRYATDLTKATYYTDPAIARD